MTPLAAALDQLQSALPAGAVVTEGSPDYDTARRLVISSIDTRPGAVVTVSSPQEVVAVLDAVRGSGLEVAIRSGRHSGAALSTTEGGIVIDTRGLDTFELDAEAGTVWVGSGLTAGEVTARLSEHGLAVGFGDTGSVGVAGITLGGGVGSLSRKYGLTIDNVLAAELVTASGEVVLGVDLSKADVTFDEPTKTARIILSEPEVFTTRFDEPHSYVHSRRTDMLAERNEGLEATARREATKAFAAAGREASAQELAKTHAEQELRALSRAWGARDLEVTWRAPQGEVATAP